MSEPTQFTAGDTVRWTRDLPDYRPADGWTLEYVFVADGDRQTVTATDAGDGTHEVHITPTASANFTPGFYQWAAYVSDGSARHTINRGSVEVLRDLVGETTGHDTRSHVKRVLDALEATLEGKATDDALSMEINGRSLRRMDPGDLLAWRDRYRAEYRREQAAEDLRRGDNHGGIVRVRL